MSNGTWMNAARSRGPRTGVTSTRSVRTLAGLGDQLEAEFLAHGVDDPEDRVELLVLVGRHVRRAQEVAPRLDRGDEDGVHEDAALDDRPPNLHRLQAVADEDRDDRGPDAAPD